MTETFNLVFFTNINDKIYMLSLKGVKIIIEDDLLAVSPHGMTGYVQGDEIYNYLNSNFGDEKRGVYEIPFKNIKNVAINEAQMGLRVLACIEFGGHGIIIFGLKSKTLEFTRKLTSQLEKSGYKVGSDKQNMPELKIINESAEVFKLKNMSPWAKYIILPITFVLIIFGIVVEFLDVDNSTFETAISVSKNVKKEPISFDEKAQTEYCRFSWTKIGKLNEGMFNYCLNNSRDAYKEYLYLYNKYTIETPTIKGFENMLELEAKDWLGRDYNFTQYVFSINNEIEGYLNTEYELNQGTYPKSKYNKCKSKWFPKFSMINACLTDFR